MRQCICYDVEEDVYYNGLKCTIEIELTSGFLSVLAPKISMAYPYTYRPGSSRGELT